MENPIANNSSIPQRGRGGGNYRGRRHGRGGRHNNSAQNSVISGNSPSSAPHGSDETTNTTSPPRPSRGNWRRSKNNRPSSTLEPSNSASIPPAPSERQPDENIPLSSSSSSVSSIPQPQQPSPKKKNNNNNRRGKQRTKNIDNITLPEDLQGILEVQLTTEKYECMCVKKWGEKSVPDPAASTSENVGWRCPGCQNVNKELASEYLCFCGKVENPQFTRGQTPHSCGQPCRKERSCPHKCSMPCHPGPCRPCESVSAPIPCYCEQTQFVVRCSEIEQGFEKSCGGTCGKLLGCGQHLCEKICHSGPCDQCPIRITQTCHCGRSTQQVPCGPLWLQSVSYSCNKKCEIEFKCGIHSCQLDCHPMTKHTYLCPTDPENIVNCPCGTKTIMELTKGKGRLKCTDPVNVCGNICNKILGCGHRCETVCHTGACPPCKQSLSTSCRCGKNILDVPCAKLPRNSQGDVLPPLCDRICKQQKQCKRHRCMEKCCEIVGQHACELVCGKMLKCGKHTCMNQCGHEGRCHDCFEGVSFDELRCNCGRTVRYPPIPCGAAVPTCSHPCTRELACGHESLSPHNCHPDSESCPPCVRFVSRQCACGKRTLTNIPCSRQGLPSCGQMCSGESEECGHKCTRFCHSGPCIDETHPCGEKCGRTRMICGHKCNFACHNKSFCTEDKPCNEKITLTCKCGHKKVASTCGAWKESIGRSGAPPLECDNSCLLAERNRKLAEAFEMLPGKDPSAAPAEKETIFEAAIRYGEKIVKHAHANLIWVKSIEGSLEEFVKEPSRRMYVFPRSKKANNYFIYLLAQHYNLNAEYVDTHFDGAGSIMIHKKSASALATIPQILASEVGAVYRPTLFAQAAAAVAAKAALNSASSATTETTDESTPVDPVSNPPLTTLNAIYLDGLQFGMESRDIQILLDGIFGTTVKSKIQWTSDDSCVIILSTQNSTNNVSRKGTQQQRADEIEVLLLSSEQSLVSKFVGSSYARSVKFCVYNDGNISFRSDNVDDESKFTNTEVETASSFSVSGNMFDLLNSDEEENTKNETKAIASTVEDNAGVVDDWEDLEDGQ
ncbi:FKBP12-associated protein [Nowakowskiella sp. JEL0407]|nr:FKBP12-associated protein [Nowakowskiella sp. JEL0407]